MSHPALLRLQAAIAEFENAFERSGEHEALRKALGELGPQISQAAPEQDSPGRQAARSAAQAIDQGAQSLAGRYSGDKRPITFTEAGQAAKEHLAGPSGGDTIAPGAPARAA